MKSRMNKLMSLCLVAMMGTTLIPQPIQAEEVSEFEEESFEEATVEFEEATFEEESNQVAESSRKTPVLDTFDEVKLRYQVTGVNTVEVIGFAQGYPSAQIEDLIIPSTVEHDNQTYDVTSIGESAFEGCTMFYWIDLPDSVTTIKKSAFKNCVFLSGINRSYYLKTIGESAFENCRILSDIEFPYTETIGKSAFKKCRKLQTFKFGYQVKTIGDSAFAGCTSLCEISLAEGLKEIGDHAFDLTDDDGKNDRPRLSIINIPSTVTMLGDNFLGGVRPNGGTELFFQGKTLPQNMSLNALDGISGNNNKPTVYFPKDAMNTYVGKDSPFVEKGLIHPDLFDSSLEQEYEIVQICPGQSKKYPNFDITNSHIKKKIQSENPNIAFADEYNGYILYKSDGETIVNLIIDDYEGEMMSEKPNKVKVKAGHKYTWQIEKFPTADQPGSMFLCCTGCGDMKESVPIPPTGGGSGGGSTGGGSGGGSTGGSTSGGSGGGSSTGGGSTIDSNAPTPQVENAVYRAYNSSNGEHLYTTNYEEFKVITKNGWDDEGIAFMSELKEKGQAVYRVYNPNNGLHHYTTDVNEKNALVSLGWNDEGVAFYTSKNPKDTPVYRVYNENDSNHHYTMDADEALALISMGWKNEGIAFFTTPMK